MIDKLFRKFALLLAVWDLTLGLFFFFIARPLLDHFGISGFFAPLPAYFIQWCGLFIVLQAGVHFLLYLDIWNKRLFLLNILYRTPIGIFHLVQYCLFLRGLDPMVDGTLLFFMGGDLTTGALMIWYYIQNRKRFV